MPTCTEGTKRGIDNALGTNILPVFGDYRQSRCCRWYVATGRGSTVYICLTTIQISTNIFAHVVHLYLSLLLYVYTLTRTTNNKQTMPQKIMCAHAHQDIRKKATQQ